MLKRLLETIVDIKDISQIVYRKDDFGMICFKHIDIECIYGDYIEIPETDNRFQQLMELFEFIDFETEEAILFRR